MKKKMVSAWQLAAVVIGLALLSVVAALSPPPLPPPPAPDSTSGHLASGTPMPVSCGSNFTTMFALGDSTTDTGNAIHSPQRAIFQLAAEPPYGSSYFLYPTGRFSDGRLMVDLLAQALHRDLLPPHLGLSSNLSHGSQNFAVAGATALDAPDLARLASGAVSITPFSLSVQVSSLLGVDFDGDALVFVGEIGGNDYNYAFLKRLQPLQVMALVPSVVAEVERQLDRLLSEQPRIKKMIILGQFPLGCISLYLGQAGSNTNTNMSFPLDTHGCIAPISAVTDLHDKLLKISVAKLRQKHGGVEIVFFDLGPAYLYVLDHAAGLGFSDTARPCYLSKTLLQLLSGMSSSPMSTTTTTSMEALSVGGGGDKLCPNPDIYFSWDSIHLTEGMHRALMSRFLYTSPSGGPFAEPHPNFLTPCV